MSYVMIFAFFILDTSPELSTQALELGKTVSVEAASVSGVAEWRREQGREMLDI